VPPGYTECNDAAIDDPVAALVAAVFRSSAVKGAAAHAPFPTVFPMKLMFVCRYSHGGDRFRTWSRPRDGTP
jgi:hypothetical protein